MAGSSPPGLPATPQLTLLRRFTLLSALILFVGAALMGWWIDRRIYQLVTEDSIELASVFVHSTIAPHLVEMPAVNALTLSQAAHLQNLIANNVATGRYAAVNLWSPSGELVYSTLAAPSGQPQSAAGLRAAAAGEVFTYATDTIEATEPVTVTRVTVTRVTVTRVTGAGVTGGTAAQPGPFLESYFPVLGHDGAPIAVIDLYQNLADLERSTLDVRLQTWAVVGTATVLMYFLLFGIVRQGSETIEAQQSALAQSRRQIQQAAVRAAAVNEAAMRRLGADLHDGPAQDLGMARMRIEPLRADVEQQLADPGAAPLDLEGAAYDLRLIDTALQSSLQEIRNLASGLRLPELSELDLAQTVRKAAGDYTRKTGRAVGVTGPADLGGSMALKSAAYRLVQESLNNGHQHGAPSRQSVGYGVAGGVLQIEIEDDGKGFDPACVRARGPRRQLGLAGLQERVEILGGHFEVHSAPGQGTRVRAVLPLTGHAAETETNV